MSDFIISFNLFGEYNNFDWDAAEEKERRECEAIISLPFTDQLLLSSRSGHVAWQRLDGRYYIGRSAVICKKKPHDFNSKTH